MTTSNLADFGVWGHYGAFTPEAAREIEDLGYRTVWLGASPPAELSEVDELLAATERLEVGTSIVNIWTAPASEVARSFTRIEQRFPGRFLLGVGVGHPEHSTDYRKPYDALVDYLDELADAGVPSERIAVAALGPRVLKLSAERSAGALPYLTTPAHTEKARQILGSQALLVAEQKVVLDTDPKRARETGRKTVGFYLGLTNYVRNLHRLGFDESDTAQPGSDRLIDVLAVHGTAEILADQLKKHLNAGADQVAIQALDADYLATLRALAPVLSG